MSKRFRWISLVAVFIIFCAVSSVYGLVFIPKLGYYAYKELAYDVIARRVTAGARQKTDAARLLGEYIFEETFAPQEYRTGAEGYRVIDKDSFNDLLRGIAVCDQRAWMLGHLAGRMGIDNRMILLKGHGISELYLDGKWCYFDPFSVVCVEGQNGRLLSLEELCNHHDVLMNQPLFIALKGYDGALCDYATGSLLQYVCGSGDASVHAAWKDPVASKNGARRLISSIISCAYSVGGKAFAYSFQDLYLLAHKDIEMEADYPFVIHNPADRAFYLARNFEIFLRWKRARSCYAEALIHPISPDIKREDVLFFYSRLLYKMKQSESSEKHFTEFVLTYPVSRWIPYVYGYLGDICNLKNEHQRAADFYTKAIDSYRQDFMPKRRVILDFRILRLIAKLRSVQRP
jgi:hypothetical protein